MERAALVQQLLGQPERFCWRQHQVVRDPLVPGHAARKRAAQGVAWPRVAGPAHRVPSRAGLVEAPEYSRELKSLRKGKP